MNVCVHKKILYISDIIHPQGYEEPMQFDEPLDISKWEVLYSHVHL